MTVSSKWVGERYSFKISSGSFGSEGIHLVRIGSGDWMCPADAQKQKPAAFRVLLHKEHNAPTEDFSPIHFRRRRIGMWWSCHCPDSLGHSAEERRRCQARPTLELTNLEAVSVSMQSNWSFSAVAGKSELKVMDVKSVKKDMELACFEVEGGGLSAMPSSWSEDGE